MIWNRILVLSALVTLAACGSDTVEPVTLPEDVDTTPEQGRLGFVNAIADSPNIVIDWESTTVENQAFADAGVVELTFGQAVLFPIDVDTYRVRLGYARVSGDPVILREFNEDNTSTIEIRNDTQITIIASGLLEDPTFTIVEETEYQHGLEVPEDGTVLVTDPEFQFAHLAHAKEPFDFYLTQSGEVLDDVDPSASLAFGEVSTLAVIEPQPDYRIRVTPQGQKSPVLYDSGDFLVVSNQRILLPIFNYFGPGDEDIRARFVDETAATFPFESNPNALRVINLVADVPEIDIHFGDTNDEPEFEAMPFGVLSDYRLSDGGSFFMNITPTGIDNQFVYQGSEAFFRGSSNTLLIAGLLEDPDRNFTRRVIASLVTEENRPIATAIQLRVFHAAPSGGLLSIFMLEPGQTTADQEPVQGAVSLGSTAVSVLEEGEYDLLVQDTITDVELFGPERISVESDSIYTLLIRDIEGGGTPLQVEIMRTKIF